MSTAEIATMPDLTHDGLVALFKAQICAIRVPDFVSPALCKSLSDWFLNNDALEDYKHELYEEEKADVTHFAGAVSRVGIPYNLTYGQPRDSDVCKLYYAAALPGIRRLRAASAPYLSPIDKLRLELDEVYTHGATVANFDGQKMFVGIGRVTMPGNDTLEKQPHYDSLPVHFGLEGQFSANIYLRVPESGGELELWNTPPLSPADIAAAEPDRNWRAELPPSFLIKPCQGDLILCNTRRPHGVRSFQAGQRVALQCFIGYKAGQPLMLWN